MIEAGVSEPDIRKALEIGRFVTDRPTAIMKEVASILTGSRLSDKHAIERVQRWG